MFTDEELTAFLSKTEVWECGPEFKTGIHKIKLKKQALMDTMPVYARTKHKAEVNAMMADLVRSGNLEITSRRVYGSSTTVLTAPWPVGKEVTVQSLRELFGPVRTRLLGGQHPSICNNSSLLKTIHHFCNHTDTTGLHVGGGHGGVAMGPAVDAPGQQHGHADAGQTSQTQDPHSLPGPSASTPPGTTPLQDSAAADILLGIRGEFSQQAVGATTQACTTMHPSGLDIHVRVI